MKVFLTGASGFVGGHILDVLRERGHSVRILLRPTSNTEFISPHLPQVQVHYGSLEDPESLREGVAGTECVVHCAGKTKAVEEEEYFRANRDGARNVARAANACGGQVRQLILISSRSVNGPTTGERPAREDGPCRPVSAYGRSKLAGERALREVAEVPWTILRPSAVYGPRDVDFLEAFKAVQRGIMPLFDGGRQEINPVYALDLAGAVESCVGERRAHGRIYNVASPRVCTARELLEEIARQMEARPLPLVLPGAVLWPLCLIQEARSRISGRPAILNLQKYRELRAPGWACSVERIRRELGFVADTPLPDGIGRTVAWYRERGWL